MTSGTAGRERWEQRWASRAPHEFHWHLEEPPPQLVELLGDGTQRSGAALDLGCGAGTATGLLARTFRPAVGIDIATAAVRRAGAVRVPETGPYFAAADATRLPFGSGRFAFVFDRGCLQSMPWDLRSGYFAEVARVLRPGGELQLLVSKPDPGPRHGLRGFVGKVRSALRADAPEGLTEDALLRLIPAALRRVRLEHFPFVTASGQRRDFIHALFRRA